MDLDDTVVLACSHPSEEDKQAFVLFSDMLEMIGTHCKRGYVYLQSNKSGPDIEPLDSEWDVVYKQDSKLVWPDNGYATLESIPGLVIFNFRENTLTLKTKKFSETLRFKSLRDDLYKEGLKKIW